MEEDGEMVVEVTAAALGRRGGFALCTTAPTILTAAAAGEEAHREEETKLEEVFLVVENL